MSLMQNINLEVIAVQFSRVSTILQKYLRLCRESELLRDRAEKAKRVWPTLCKMTKAVMNDKAELQIKVNDTR